MYDQLLGGEDCGYEGLIHVSVYRPENPLQVLGEFLLQRSKDLEGVKQESTT